MSSQTDITDLGQTPSVPATQLCRKLRRFRDTIPPVFRPAINNVIVDKRIFLITSKMKSVFIPAVLCLSMIVVSKDKGVISLYVCVNYFIT